MGWCFEQANNKQKKYLAVGLRIGQALVIGQVLFVGQGVFVGQHWAIGQL
jgi:hypothetical protein